MRKSTIWTLILTAIAATVGCSPAEPATAEPTTESVSVSPEDALRTAAEDMNRSVAAREAERAWEFYSPRCQNLIGDAETFRLMFDENYRDRDAEPVGVTVRVDGAFGQVVTVDQDSSAPAASMHPRTWTLIDGQWRFDNC